MRADMIVTAIDDHLGSAGVVNHSGEHLAAERAVEALVVSKTRFQTDVGRD